GAHTGVWRTRARMHKLRTAKQLVGPELGITALGFRAWFEARQGREAYAALDRIPRLAWADYLDWFRGFVGIGVRHGTRLLSVSPLEGGAVTGLRLTLEVNGQQRSETTRKLVLANGIAGNGAPIVPAWLQPLRSAGLAAHTADTIDFAALAGRRVAVIGAAASAFDAAATALEAGAAALHLFVRRDGIAARAVAKPRAYPGFYDNHHALPDALRWQHALRHRRAGSTPPADALQRVLLHKDSFHLHLNAAWSDARAEGGQVVTTVQGQTFAFDFVIAGTGYSSDPSQRAELAMIAPQIARWRDRYTPPPGDDDDALAASPYLGAGLEYQARTPGTAPWLGAIHVFNPAGFTSAGGPLGDVPSMRRDVPAAVRRISQDLFLEDLDLHATRAQAEVAPDFGPELYARAVWQPG
ncbi:MAG: SidA/IucD/PvdA family monooxygenase, partial [Rubrivivax sp.]